MCSLNDYIQRAIVSEDAADREALDLAGHLTVEQIRAIAAREDAMFGRGGEVAKDLPKLQEAMHIEEMRRLLPGYVRRYLEHAAPTIDGDLDSTFFLRARKKGALDSVIPLLQTYPESARARHPASLVLVSASTFFQRSRPKIIFAPFSSRRFS